ncbi:beta-d-glucosyl crocetin beta-1 6-glucosyltransferase [Phtheirospermum japonicum]|uniref:Glycosyltransferase n=1 Tax=Phtheirospermum japonicum TaxID=374723 RepID=A0A830CI09_9LAMI|nr:beta-d-glucosyl crocetin beta-1 6-glucosyltransferase [Phtheirospermum japonicum]
MGSQKDCLKVVLFPWLAHGHISPFLELAKTLISHKNLRCYIISTPANLTSIRTKIPDERIQLVELHLPTSPDLPPHHHTTNGLPTHLHTPLRKALKTAKPEFSNLLTALKPDLVIHDILQPWAGLVASQHNLPSVTFFTASAAPLSYFIHLGTHPGDDFPFPAIQLDSFQLSMVLGYIESYKDEDNEEASRGDDTPIMLVNTSREMEGKYMDYLSEMMSKTIVPVGALVRDPSLDDGDGFEAIMEWLGSKDERSTVLVSFGTEYYLKKEEVEEMASGLEMSKVNFIWVLRFPEGEEREALPEGFVERVGERGRVVEKWAPQARILRHSSVGGFVSHCGWSSLRESIDCGVPIVAVPMHLDQPVNAKLVVELGVGVEVRRDEVGKLKRDEISRVIGDVVVGRNGDELRRRVGERRESIRLRSREEAEDVARVLTEICAVKEH